MTLKEKILVLRTFKHGEADLVVHGLNPLGARMNFFARGAMKSRKRFAGGVLEPTHYIEVTYKQGASSDSDPLHSLLEANLVRTFEGLRSNYSRLRSRALSSAPGAQARPTGRRGFAGPVQSARQSPCRQPRRARA